MTCMLHPAVFLDRDGVINKAIVRNGLPYPPSSLNELLITPNANHVLLKLKEAGFLLIGITNQPDVARGTQKREIVEEINTSLLSALPIKEILVCYHDDDDQCSCRKPNPGLIFEAVKKFSIDLSRSFMVGDRWKDILAGKNAGVKTIFINYDYQEPKPIPSADYTVNSLEDILAIIL